MRSFLRHGPVLHNYGCLPQTWEDPSVRQTAENLPGNHSFTPALPPFPRFGRRKWRPDLPVAASSASRTCERFGPGGSGALRRQ